MASASKTISLNVTANTEKYVSELRKLGSHTEKQIGTAARKASATFQKAELENIKNAQIAAAQIQKVRERAADASARAEVQAARKAASDAARAVQKAERDKQKAAKDTVRKAKRAEKEKASAAKKAAKESADAWRHAAVAVVAGIVLAAKAIKDMVDEIQGIRTGLAELNVTSGLTTETLAGLSAAAARNGKELSQFDSVLKDLPKRMLETSMGIGRAIRGFDGLGVSVEDASGNLRQSDDVLKEVLSKLQGIEDPTRRSALAVQTLGGDGAKLMQVLGGTELETFIGYATEFGMDVGPDAIKAAQDWEAASAELGVEMNRISSHMVDAIGLTSKLRGFTTGLSTAYMFFVEIIKDASIEMVTLAANFAEFMTMGASDASNVRALRELHYEMGNATDRVAAATFARLQALEAMERTTDAAGVATAVTRESARATEDAAKKVQAYDAALKGLNATVLDSGSDQDTREDAITDAYVRRLDAIQALTDRAEEAAETETELQRALQLQMEMGHSAEMRQARDLDALQAQMADEQLGRAGQVADTIGQASNMLTNILVANAKKQGKAEEGKAKAAQLAAKIAFKAQQAAALAGVIIDTMRNVVSFAALPPLGLGPIVGPPVALAMGVTAGAGIAAQAPPAFATGGIVQNSAPRTSGSGMDERAVTARPGEGIFTPDQMAAMGGGGKSTTVNLVLDNRTMQRVVSNGERDNRTISRAMGAPSIRHYADRRAA